MGPTAPGDSTPWFHTVIQIAENRIKPWPVMFVDDEHVGMTLQGRSLQMWIVMRKAEMIILMAKLKDDTVIHRHLKTPKSAAVAGIVFSLLMFAIFGFIGDPFRLSRWSPEHGSPPIRRRLLLR